MSTSSDLLQTTVGYIKFAAEFLNNKLSHPAQFIQNTLSLRTESLPETFKTPLNFSTMLAFIFFIIVTYANSLICNIIGILYPVLYGFYLFNETPLNSTKLIVLNKYWMLFGLFTLADIFFGFILHFVPGFFYAKIAIIYALVRNDFMLTGLVFSLLESYYAKSNFRPVVDTIILNVNSRLRKQKSTTMTETEFDETEPLDTEEIVDK